MIKFSDRQKLAYSTIDKNVCVNAGAGTGKTEVVSERFKYMYENVIDIKGIVCITFTNKAADEMKERIIQKLNNPKLIDDVNVSTISSFCKKIVSDNSYYLSIDPNFSIMEENDSNKIIREVIDKVSESNIDSIKILGESLDISYKETVGVLLSTYIKFRTNNVKISDAKSQTLNYLNKLRDIRDEDIVNVKNYILDIKNEVDGIKGFTKSMKFVKFLDDENQNLSGEDYSDFLMNSLKNLGDSKKEHVQSYIDDMKEKIINLLINKEKDCIKLYEIFFDLLNEIDKLYSIEKTQNGSLDFNDIEIMCKNVLENPDILNSSKNKYKYFMIDEFQDTSNLQRDIFYMLCSDQKNLDRNNLFVVGDPKQAIYSFRGANIKVFETTKSDILKSGGINITFDENYRTHPNIMESINYIYSNEMNGRYDKLIAMNQIGDIIGQDEYAKNNKDEKTKNDSCDILVSNITKDDYKDTAILARTKDDLKFYEKSLNSRNIPYYIFDKQGLENCREVLNLIQFIKFARSGDDISKVGVLSNIYDLEYDEILNQTRNYDSANEDLKCHIEKFLYDISNYTIYETLNNYIDSINYFEKFDDLQSKANIIKFLEIAEKFDDDDDNIEDFLDYFEKNQKLYQMAFEDENSKLVKLMTIHKSKGLGFQNVIVDNISKSSHSRDKYVLHVDDNKLDFVLDFPNSAIRKEIVKSLVNQDEIYENDNLYYTAFTRAKRKLSFSNSKSSGHFKYIRPYVENLHEQGMIKYLDLNENEIIIEKNLPKYSIITPKEYNLTKYNSIGITSILNSDKVSEEFDYETSKINYTLLGNLVHLYAKLYDGEEVELKEIKLLNEDELKIFDKSVENFKKTIHDFSNYKNEMDFSLLYKNIIISGFMDRVEFSDDEIKVYDYKISSSNREILYDKYHMQLKFYSYVLNKNYNKTVKMILVNLRKGYTIEKRYDEICEKEVEDFLDNYLNKLN